MVARHHPRVTWRADFSGNASFSSDLTPWVLDGSYVRYGSGISRFSPLIQFQPASGQLLLDNESGRFDFIGGAIPARDLARPRRIQLLLDGEVWWQGRCILNAEALAEDNRVAPLSLLPRGSTLYSQPLRVVDNFGGGQFVDKLREFARTTHVESAAEQEHVFSFEGAPVLQAGRIFYSGYWPEMLDWAGNMFGGYCYETNDGAVRVAVLERAMNSTSSAVLGGEELYGPRGGALPYTVANWAGFRATRLQGPINDQGITTSVPVATVEYTVSAGTPITVSWQFRPRDNLRLVVWDPQPLQTDQPLSGVGQIITTERGISAIVVPSQSGTMRVSFWGIPYRPEQAYELIDRPVDDSTFLRSARANGLRELLLPDWQATPIDEVGIDHQRRFVRLIHEPLILRVHGWSMHQPSSATALSLRDNAQPGRVVSVGGRKELILGTTIYANPAEPSVEIRSIDLDALPAIGALPDLRLPGDPTDPTSVTRTGDKDIDDVIGDPPGVSNCNVEGNVLTLQWSTGGIPSRGYYGGGPPSADSFTAGPGTLVARRGTGHFGTTRSTVVSTITAADERAGAAGWWATTNSSGTSITVQVPGISTTDGVPVVYLIVNGESVDLSAGGHTVLRQGDPEVNTRWYYSGGSNAFAVGDTVRGFIAEDPAESITRLLIARGDATIEGPGVPAGTKILLESDEINAASLTTVANGIREIRGVDVNFGPLLGSDFQGGLNRAFFGGDNDQDLGCEDFDLVSPGAPPVDPDTGSSDVSVQITTDSEGTLPVTTVSRPAGGALTLYLQFANAANYATQVFRTDGSTERTRILSVPANNRVTLQVPTNVNRIAVIARRSDGQTAGAQVRITEAPPGIALRSVRWRSSDPTLDSDSFPSWGPGRRTTSTGSSDVDDRLEVQFFDGNWDTFPAAQYSNPATVVNGLHIVEGAIPASYTRARGRNAPVGDNPGDWTEVPIASERLVYSPGTMHPRINVNTGDGSVFKGGGGANYFPAPIQTGREFAYRWVDTGISIPGNTNNDDMFVILTDIAGAGDVKQYAFMSGIASLDPVALGDAPRLYPDPNFVMLGAIGGTYTSTIIGQVGFTGLLAAGAAVGAVASGGAFVTGSVTIGGQTLAAGGSYVFFGAGATGASITVSVAAGATSIAIVPTATLTAAVATASAAGFNVGRQFGADGNLIILSEDEAETEQSLFERGVRLGAVSAVVAGRTSRRTLALMVASQQASSVRNVQVYSTRSG